MQKIKINIWTIKSRNKNTKCFDIWFFLYNIFFSKLQCIWRSIILRLNPTQRKILPGRQHQEFRWIGKKIWSSDFPMWFYQSNHNASNLYVSQIQRAHLIWYQSTAWTKYTDNRHAHFTRKHVLSLRCLLMIKTNCHFISNLHCFIF